MRITSSLPECPFYKTNCFAFKIIDCREKCTVLADTDFKTDYCPFYKTTEEYKAGLQKYPWDEKREVMFKRPTKEEIEAIDYDDLLIWYYERHPKKIPNIADVLKDEREVRFYIESRKTRG